MTRPLALSIGFVIVGVVYSQAGGSEPTLEAITKAWRGRQDQVRSAKFAWTGRHTYAKGAVLDPSLSRIINPKGLTIPRETTSFEVRTRLIFQENKMRYSFKGQMWSEQNKLVPQEYISAYDGMVSKIFMPVWIEKYPNGVIKAERHNDDIQNIYAKPILLTYRPLCPEMGGLNIAEFAVSQQKGMINNVACVIMEDLRKPARPGTVGGDRVTLWVDPDRNYSILRTTLSQNGNVLIKIDVAYKPAPGNGWVPSGWDIVWQRPDGSLKESFEAKVTEANINPPMSTADFQIDFPAGTWVVDERTKSDLGKFSSYIVRDNGGKRMITASELGASYDQLRTTERGMALRPRRPFLISRSLIFANIAILCGILVFFIWKYWRRKAANR